MNSFERTINKFRTAASKYLPISIDGSEGKARATLILNDSTKVTIESKVDFEGESFEIQPDDLKIIKRVDNLRLVRNGVFYGDLEVKIPVSTLTAPMAALEYEPGEYEVTKQDMEYILLAASTDNTRPVLNSVLFTANRLASTDGFRLHLVPGTYHIKENYATLLPTSALDRIKSDFAITHKIDYSIITFENLGNRVIMRVPWVQRTFPDFSSIIPKETKIKFILPVDKRFKKVANDKFGIVTFNDHLEYETREEMTGTTCTRFEVVLDYLQGKPTNAIKFGIKPKYLLEAIRGDSVEIGFNAHNGPIVVGDSVVMPMHLS